MESTDKSHEKPVDFLPARIMVCFDGSTHSLRALSVGISLASKYQSLLTVTYAIPLPLNGFGLGEPYYEWDQFEKAAKARIEKQIRPYTKKASASDIALETSYLGGTVSVPETLLNSAENTGADLIIMGSRGLGGFRGMLLGSVSQAMVTNAKVPVLIVK